MIIGNRLCQMKILRLHKMQREANFHRFYWSQFTFFSQSGGTKSSSVHRIKYTNDFHEGREN